MHKYLSTGLTVSLFMLLMVVNTSSFANNQDNCNALVNMSDSDFSSLTTKNPKEARSITKSLSTCNLNTYCQNADNVGTCQSKLMYRKTMLASQTNGVTRTPALVQNSFNNLPSVRVNQLVNQHQTQTQGTIPGRIVPLTPFNNFPR